MDETPLYRLETILKISWTIKCLPEDLKTQVIRAGLRLLEEEESKIVALKKAIEEGFESGLAKSFNAKKHLEKLKIARQKNG